MDIYHNTQLCIGFTTTTSKSEAERIASKLLKSKLAACIQIDGPILSMYTWEDKIDSNEEYRLLIKFLKPNASAIETLLKEAHSYEVPEWVYLSTLGCSEEYLKWIHDSSPKG